MPTMMTTDVLMARQPIVDRKEQVFGYEVTFTGATGNHTFRDCDAGTARQTLEDVMNQFDLATISNGKLSFVNLPPDAIRSGAYRALPADTTIIELTNVASVDEALFDACKELCAEGYRLSLNDFSPRSVLQRLAPLAEYVKVNMQAMNLGDDLKTLRQWTLPGHQLIAKKVDTRELFRQALEAGFELMQGYSFCEPAGMGTRKLPTMKAVYLKFLQEVNKPDLSFEDLEKTIKQDSSLSLGLLKLINSAALGVRNEVKSIKHALVLLGELTLRRWASSLAISQLNAGKPTELARTCLTRAFFCEQIGKGGGMVDRDMDLFLVGLVSGLDAMLDCSMTDLVKQLALVEDLSEALCGKENELGRILMLVLAYELGDFTRMSVLASSIGIQLDRVAKAFYGALAETKKIAI